MPLRLLSNARRPLTILLSLGLLLWVSCIKLSDTIAPHRLSPETLSDQDFAFQTAYAEHIESATNGNDSCTARGKLAQFYHANGFLREAAALYDELQLCDPADPRWPYYLALIKQDAGEVDSAISLHEQSYQRDTSVLISVFHQAELLRKSGRTKAAIDKYQACLKHPAYRAEASLGMGALAVTRGEWTEAADWLEVAIAPPAQLTRAYRLLSTVYRKLGRESAARYISEKADKLGRQSDPYDPWWDETHQYCFDSYRLTVFADKRVAEGKLEEARQILRRAMEIDPQNARAHFDLAMLSGDNPWATSNRILLLEKAIERDPKFTDAYLELALALTNSEQIPTALEIIAQGLQHQPKAPGLHRMRGRIMQREKKYREAQQSLERGIALNVNDPDGYIALGNFHWARGDKRTAAAQYTRATELSMLVIEPRAMLATYLIEQGEFDRAIAQLESTQFLVTEVEGLTELHALAYLRKGNAALHGQNFIIGEAALKRALEIDPSSTEAFNNLCNFYLTADRLKAAQILSDSFLQHNPADLFGYQLAAGVEMKRGHPRAAIAILQRGVEQAKSQGQTPTRRELELLIDTIERGSSG